MKNRTHSTTDHRAINFVPCLSLVFAMVFFSTNSSNAQTPPNYSSGTTTITDANWSTMTASGAIGEVSGTAVVNIRTTRPSRAISVARVSGGTVNVGTPSTGGRSRVTISDLRGGALDVAQSGMLTITAISGSIASLNVSGAVTLPSALIVTGAATFGETAVLNGGSLQAASFSLSGGTIRTALVGTGTLTKTGAGTATLLGANTFSGGTVISAGTLSVTSLTLQGSVTNNGVLQFNQDRNGLFWGDVSGSGQLIKSGLGSLRLTGSNTYTGGTTVSSGTLLVTTSSLPSSTVTNNATLQFNQDRSGNFAGAIVGTGAVVKTGAGVVVLSGANTYSGATIINGGKLVADSGSLPSGGPVVNNATLQFNQRGSQGAFSGTISGTGNLVSGTSGELTLTGVNSYLGTTEVARGQLYIDGNQAGATGAVTVASAATLGGTGTVGGATTITPGGRHLIGTTLSNNNAGQQTFSSSLTYSAGSTAFWRLTGNSTNNTVYDRAIVGSALTIDPSAVFNLSFDSIGSAVDWSDTFWSTEKLGTQGWLVYNAGSLVVSGDVFTLNPPRRWIDSQGDSLQAVRPDYVFAFYRDTANSDLYLNYIYSP